MHILPSKRVFPGAGEGSDGGGTGHVRRGKKGRLFVDIAPNKPTEAGYQEQQERDAGPAQPLVGAVSAAGVAARFAGIFGETHPAVFVGECSSRLMGGEIAPDPFFLIEPYDPGVLPDHTFIEDPARENIEVLLFEGDQVAVADFSDPGNGVQSDSAEFPLLPQCIAEFPHTLHPPAGRITDIFHHKAAL
jgi:hypothetical protein